jgi:hypothetical protein
MTKGLSGLRGPGLMYVLYWEQTDVPFRWCWQQVCALRAGPPALSRKDRYTYEKHTQ